ncbi:hypothetical protein FHG87_014293 [Trinorchestia longiramus]|nr:hypothetical protein FHG87_014293 [Trinorchestia longiramus]
MTSTAYLPSEWEDDDRMAVLFKPLPPPSQSVAYTARLNFWAAALHSWTAATDSFTFTLQDVQQAFLRKCQTPQCLSEVIATLLNKGSLCTATSLAEDADKKETWGSWGVRLLLVPPQWAWGKVRGTHQNISPHEQLVDLTLLKSRSRQLYDDYWKMNSASQLLPRARSLSSLCVEMRATFTSVSSLELAVRWLTGQGLAAVAERDGVIYVKFASPGKSFPPDYVLPLCDTGLCLPQICKHLK